jgi:uncharacterized damage-inducible protein DinB
MYRFPYRWPSTFNCRRLLGVKYSVIPEVTSVDLKEFFLKQKQAVHRGTLDVFGKIPSERLDWRPAEGMLSLGEIVRHTWMSEEGLRRVALDGDWSYFAGRVPMGLPRFLAAHGPVESLAKELSQVESVHQETLLRVRNFPLERWDEERNHEQFNIHRRVSAMLFGLNEHQIHHRAQVGAYLHILTGASASPYAL